MGLNYHGGMPSLEGDSDEEALDDEDDHDSQLMQHLLIYQSQVESGDTKVRSKPN